jgi:tetratricopeptide (TPR) repeat protein/predicted Ser/Thr protein kinase
MTELPQKIGPYRVLQRLGAGGMGEVFLAHDERLDRHVAIKRIRPEAGTSPDQRERFRREARVAARLNHPAIVQIYDILQEGEVEHIVMEYVEGETLRSLSRELLDLPLALRLAREIADGLDSAHREGIVHRDLKSENVLVTRFGHAKIGDFGIAKQLLAGNEPQLTQGNVVLGTYRIMSPEQARGEAVDHRSDLFSLGILLYEILAGQSPFEAENPLATLNRILFHTPTPVHTLRPEVPEEISSLVDQLLQKDPFVRPRSAGQVRWHLDTILSPGTGGEEAPTLMEPGLPSLTPATGRSTPLPRTGASTPAPTPVSTDSALTTLPPRRRRLALLVAIGVLLAGLASVGAWLALRKPGPPVYVGVLEPEIGTGAGADEVELLAAGVRVALLQGLVGLERISPLSTDEVDAATGPPRQVAKAVSADEVVGTRLDCRAEACRVSLNRVRGSDGAVIWAESFEVPTDDYSLVAGAAVRHIQRGYAGFRPRRGSAGLATSGRDFEEFLELRRRFRAREVNHQEVADGLAEIRRSSPRFVEPYLLGVEVARARFWTSRDRGEIQKGLDLIREAQRLAPDDPRPLFSRLDFALLAQDVDDAEKALEELDALVPGDVRLLERKAWILRAQGRADEALTLTRTAAEVQPSSKRLADLAQMEIQQGHLAEARKTLDQALQRSPGSYSALSLLAVLELYNGDLNRAVEIYRELVRRSPGQLELSNLGLAYFSLGRYEEAAETYRQLVEREPANPLFVLNLADTYLLMGRKREARDLYEKVLELIAADPATPTPQYLTVKAQALAQMGRGREAVAAVQEALRLAPNDGPVAYEAGLVYALLGENDSALVNVERALSLGQGARWFALPWFAPLRSDPEFQRLLDRASASSGAPPES